jgi:dihydrodipicolinate synthase/N-acetylneuraminate lyase
MIQTTRAVREDFAVLSGYDEYYIPNLLAGGAGIISGLNNVMPELFVSARKRLNRATWQRFAIFRTRLAPTCPSMPSAKILSPPSKPWYRVSLAIAPACHVMPVES